LFFADGTAIGVTGRKERENAKGGKRERLFRDFAFSAFRDSLHKSLWA
jgi:hypothetical protein